MNQVLANGPIDITLHTAHVEYSQETTDPSTGYGTATIISTPRASLYSINNLASYDNLMINGESGVSLALDGTLQSGYKDLSVRIDNTDPSFNSSEYLDSITATDINLEPISERGGTVIVNLVDGTFITPGVATLLDGYMHIAIQNATDKNLNLSSIDINDRINGSFLYNENPLSFVASGYESGQLDITNSGNGKISIFGDLQNISGSITITGHNGLFDPSASLILAHDMMLDISANDIGTSTDPIQVSGELSANAADDIYLHAPDEMLINQIIGHDLFLQSDNTMMGLSTNTPNLVANWLELSATNNIGSSTTPLSIQATLINTAQSQNGDIYVQSDSDMKLNFIEAPLVISLSSQNGAITQDGDSAIDIQSNQLILHANNGIGDNGVSEDYLDLAVNILDAYNESTNDIALKNSGSLSLFDLNLDDYALYNGGGAIKLLINGALSQQSGTHIFANGDINIKTVGNIFASDMKSNRDITIYTTNGSILGDPATSPNLVAKKKLTLHADNGVVGNPANPLTIIKGAGGVEVQAKAASNFLSVYIFDVSSAGNFFTDQDLAVYNNRIISGSLIEIYFKLVFQNKEIPTQDLARWLDFKFQNLRPTRFDDFINISLLN